MKSSNDLRTIAGAMMLAAALAGCACNAGAIHTADAGSDTKATLEQEEWQKTIDNVSKNKDRNNGLSLRLDNPQKYLDQWQEYLNSCSEIMRSKITARAERSRKTAPEDLLPLFDALLNHPSETALHPLPVYTVSYADFQQATAETLLTDVARLDTSRMNCLVVMKGTDLSLTSW